jgi:hypothetical protein
MGAARGAEQSWQRIAWRYQRGQSLRFLHWSPAFVHQTQVLAHVFSTERASGGPGVPDLSEERHFTLVDGLRVSNLGSLEASTTEFEQSYSRPF